MTRAHHPRRKRNRRDITKHATARLTERYGVDANSSVPQALACSIRKHRSVHIGWQRRGTVHAVNGPTGLAIVLYANQKVQTALPMDDPYLCALEAYFLTHPPRDERERRIRNAGAALRAELPELGRPWHSFEPRYEHPHPQQRPTNPNAPPATPTHAIPSAPEEEHALA